MRFDVEKRLFFTKKLYELKSVALVQRANRSEYKNKKCPTKATILNLSRKFDRTGSLLDLPPKPKNEKETLIRLNICSPKIRHYRSEMHQLMSVFRILFAVIYFLKTYASSRTNIKVFISYRNSIVKKLLFLLNGG